MSRFAPQHGLSDIVNRAGFAGESNLPCADDPGGGDPGRQTIYAEGETSFEISPFLLPVGVLLPVAEHRIQYQGRGGQVSAFRQAQEPARPSGRKVLQSPVSPKRI